MKKKYLAIAATISLLAFSNAFATEYVVTTEAELTAANDAAVAGDTIKINGNIFITRDIVLNVPVSLMDNTYTITNMGFEITTSDGSFDVPDNVTVKGLVVDNTIIYAKNSKSGNGGAIEYDYEHPTAISGGARFLRNSAMYKGGAIYNKDLRSTYIIDGGSEFTGNTANQFGGAIYNYRSEMILNDGVTFSDNSSQIGGGAVYNEYSSILTINGGATFSNNFGKNAGGAIHNRQADLTINGGTTFTSNSTNYNGGAIYTYLADTFINDGATFTSNSANTSGGAIYNYYSSKLAINDGATFTSNISGYYGGAIYNFQNSKLEINGGATFTDNSASRDGGAIYNSDNSKLVINGGATFTNNSASINGGAICNNSILAINDGATFTGNSAVTAGGAIYTNNSITTLIADTQDVLFDGNTAAGADNAIHMNNVSVVNLNASDIASVIFNDAITSEGDNNIIRINETGTWDQTNYSNDPLKAVDGSDTANSIRIDAPTAGEIVLNTDMSGFGNHSGSTGNTVGLYGGTLSLGADGVFFGSVDFMATPGSTLNLINNKIDAISFNTADINNMNLNIDVDLELDIADTLNTVSVGANNDITLTGLNLINEGTDPSSTVIVDPDNEFDITIGSSAKNISGQVYDYSVTSNGDGTLSFDKITVNPVVQTPSATQQSVQINIATANNIVFNRVDDVMNIMDTIQNQTGIDYRFVNKVAAIEGQAEYSKLYGRLQEGSVWFRPFSSIEEITVDNMPGKVDSVSYGALVGIDSPLYSLGKGRRGMLSIYGGYSGASQDYADVDLYQNGGMFGVMGALYKGNFYTSLSTNVGGYSVVENIDNYGSSDYSLFTTSLASKTGYNWHLPKQTVLQLNNQLAYNLVVTQDYNNAMGTRIKTDPLHAIQIIPGIKLSKNINGWQPYLSASVTFNALNESKVTANDVVLPDSSIGSYVEYGAGIQNYNDKGPGGFVQVMVRNGSRTGVAFKFGLKAPIGKRETEKI